MPTGSKTRVAWEDRFRVPTPEELLQAPTKQADSLMAECRERLLGLDGVSEELSWHGVPWRWTFAYRLEDADLTRAFAYLVPQPGRARIAVPLTQPQLAALPLRKLSKFIRDGLLHATEVGGVRWAQWEPTARTQCEEILKIVEIKLQTSLQAEASLAESEHVQRL